MTDDLEFSTVSFERPVLREIHDAGLHAVDMHYHTSHSDGAARVRDVLKLAEKRGVGLAITDHNEISGVIEAERERCNVLVIPGIEISATEGPHILIYFSRTSDLAEFYHEQVEPCKGPSPYLATRLTTEQIVEHAGRYGGIRVAAHPCGYLFLNRGVARCIERECLDEGIMEHFEGIEAICGTMNRDCNQQAAALADRYHLGITGGTDGHLLEDLGRVVTCAGTSDREEFLDAIIRRRTLVIGAEKNILEKGMMGGIVLTKYIRYTVPSLQVHYEQNMPRVERFFKRTARRFRR